MTLGVGYSLMPSIAPTRVAEGVRYSMVSVPKSRRVVARPSLNSPAGNGTRRHSPLISKARYSRSEERQLQPRAHGSCSREGSGEHPGSQAGGWAVQQGEVELIDHQRFAGEALAIPRGQNIHEAAPCRDRLLRALGATDHVSP